jgi:ATP-binding cassette, subfamily F, member 3
MLTVSDVTKSYGGRVLFEDATLQVNRGDRVALVGPNGAGKTTLFQLILGAETPDAGTINLQRGASVGYLPQESAPVRGETVLELALTMELKAAHDSDAPPHDGASAHATLGIPLLDHYADGDGFHLEAKAKKILKGLGFRDSDFDRPAREMSGGWVMRAHLARLLVREPDLLLLDEPTNHLDLEALLWFQEYLRHYPGAILLISHDREFLNQLAGSIVEIRQRRLWRYRGNYDEFLVQREAQETQLEAAYKNQQREIAQLMRFVERFRAKNTKASQAQSKLKQIERMEKIEAPAAEDASIDFRFPQPARSGLKVITLENIHQAYGSHVVYEGMNFEAERGQRMVLVGPNGAGKSTLLKILAGVVPFQSGLRKLGHNVRSGYYAQYRQETLHPERTVLEEALDTPQRVTEQFVRTVLGCFLFRGDDVFKRVSVLSGGEKSRLALVKLLLDPPNLLLMDEPTTHLDLASVEALIGALEQFEGTLIFISHDVYFIRSLANHVVHVNEGQLRRFPGDYQYYLDKTKAESERLGLTAGGSGGSNPFANAARGEVLDRAKPSIKSREQKRLEAEQRQARSRELRAQREQVQSLEKQIAALEQQQTALTAELEKAETYQKPGRALEVNRELTDTIERLSQLSAEWESAATRLNAMERKPD